MRSGYAPVFFRHHLISIARRSGRKETAAAPLPSPLDRDSRQFPPLWLPLLLPLLLLLCFCFASLRFPSLVRRICCLPFSPPHSCFLQRISLPSPQDTPVASRKSYHCRFSTSYRSVDLLSPSNPRLRRARDDDDSIVDSTKVLAPTRQRP